MLTSDGSSRLTMTSKVSNDMIYNLTYDINKIKLEC